MSIINVAHLSKSYRIHHKEPGLLGSIKGLIHRRFSDITAVNDISFQISEGELVGFIGSNGAGKTTTLKILSGLLYPSSGQVSVMGYTPWERQPQFQKQFSLVMGQKNQLWWDLPAIESFVLNKEIYEVPTSQYHRILDELVELLEVKDLLKVQVRKLSLGQRMKMELIAALIHAPKVLFLDEPTIGLDVVMQKKMRDFIKYYNQKYSSTIILTSHYMDDVKELCHRVIIIDQGKIIFDGSLSDIISQYADHKLISIVLSQPPKIKQLQQLGVIKSSSYPKFTLSVKRDQVSHVATRLLKDFGVADLNIEEPRIEDIVREIFTGKDFA